MRLELRAREERYEQVRLHLDTNIGKSHAAREYCKAAAQREAEAEDPLLPLLAALEASRAELEGEITHSDALAAAHLARFREMRDGQADLDAYQQAAARAVAAPTRVMAMAEAAIYESDTITAAVAFSAAAAVEPGSELLSVPTLQLLKDVHGVYLDWITEEVHQAQAAREEEAQADTADDATGEEGAAAQLEEGEEEEE